jgi:hypothetical protein
MVEIIILYGMIRACVGGLENPSMRRRSKRASVKMVCILPLILNVEGEFPQRLFNSSLLELLDVIAVSRPISKNAIL